MMIASQYLTNEIRFADAGFNTLVIENTKLFRNVVHSFEANEEKDYFTFSLDYTPFEFGAKGVYISNPLVPSLDNKKLTSKLISNLERIGNDELPEQTAQIKESLIEYACRVSQQSEFEVEFDTDIETVSIIKFLGFSVGMCDDPCQRLITYMVTMFKYLKIRLFVVVNLHLFLNTEELQLLIKTLSLKQINVLCLETVAPGAAVEGETVHIIDSDLCCIDKETIV